MENLLDTQPPALITHELIADGIIPTPSTAFNLGGNSRMKSIWDTATIADQMRSTSGGIGIN
jgi:hypothetical protein